MKTTRIAADEMGHKMVVQLAYAGVWGAKLEVVARVINTRKKLGGGNGRLANLGWSKWLWDDAKKMTQELGF